MSNTINKQYNKKLLNNTHYQTFTGRNISNIKNLKFLSTTPSKIPKFQKKIKEGITQGNIIHNINNTPHNYNLYENTQSNILGNNDINLYIQPKKLIFH